MFVVDNLDWRDMAKVPTLHSRRRVMGSQKSDSLRDASDLTPGTAKVPQWNSKRQHWCEGGTEGTELGQVNAGKVQG